MTGFLPGERLHERGPALLHTLYKSIVFAREANGYSFLLSGQAEHLLTDAVNPALTTAFYLRYRRLQNNIVLEYSP
ncbi:MAG TPA: hypothetical protein VJ440_06935 [Candidatus Brocadiaceae bacterium]|nr:hypothetical protein [Candidatus Brocadiaceae bacterium]